MSTKAPKPKGPLPAEVLRRASEGEPTSSRFPEPKLLNSSDFHSHVFGGLLASDLKPSMCTRVAFRSPRLGKKAKV